MNPSAMQTNSSSPTDSIWDQSEAITKDLSRFGHTITSSKFIFDFI